MIFSNKEGDIIRPDRFENEEINFIKNNFDKMTYKEINDYLNCNYNKDRNEKQIRRKARYLGLSKINTTINKNYFELIDNADNSYWLGFIYADGYISGDELGIQLSYKDINHLEKFNKCINGNLEIKIKEEEKLILNRKCKTISKSCTIRVFSKKIVADLINNKLVRNKTYNKIYPVLDDDYLFFNFLRGYFDGDGCVWFEKRNPKNVYCKITSLNNNILLYIKDKLEKYNIRSEIYYSENEYKNICNLHILGSIGDKINFLDLLYKDSKIYLDRKYQLYKNAVQVRNNLNN